MWIIPTILGLAAVGVLFYGTAKTHSDDKAEPMSTAGVDDRPAQLGGSAAGTGDRATSHGQSTVTHASDTWDSESKQAWLDEQLDKFGGMQGVEGLAHENENLTTSWENMKSELESSQKDYQEASSKMKVYQKNATELSDEMGKLLKSIAPGGHIWKQMKLDITHQVVSEHKDEQEEKKDPAVTLMCHGSPDGDSVCKHDDIPIMYA